MSSPFQYWGRGSQMSADLKQVGRRVRAKRPELFASQHSTETSQDGNGNITQKKVAYTRAIAMSGAERHALSLQTERF